MAVLIAVAERKRGPQSDTVESLLKPKAGPVGAPMNVIRRPSRPSSCCSRRWLTPSRASAVPCTGRACGSSCRSAPLVPPFGGTRNHLYAEGGQVARAAPGGGFERYADPEVTRGIACAGLYGAAGYPNGEMQTCTGSRRGGVERDCNCAAPGGCRRIAQRARARPTRSAPLPRLPRRGVVGDGCRERGPEWSLRFGVGSRAARPGCRSMSPGSCVRATRDRRPMQGLSVRLHAQS